MIIDFCFRRFQIFFLFLLCFSPFFVVLFHISQHKSYHAQSKIILLVEYYYSVERVLKEQQQ